MVAEPSSGSQLQVGKRSKGNGMHRERNDGDDDRSIYQKRKRKKREGKVPFSLVPAAASHLDYIHNWTKLRYRFWEEGGGFLIPLRQKYHVRKN